MTIPASHCEAVLRGMSKRADKEGDWIEVKFQLHPNEVPPALWNADLRSRWQLAFVEIGPDEQPVTRGEALARDGKVKPVRAPATTRAEKARRLCGVATFRQFTREELVRLGGALSAQGYPDTYEVASNAVKWLCAVKSKNDIDGNPNAARQWDDMLTRYEQKYGRMAERH